MPKCYINKRKITVRPRSEVTLNELDFSCVSYDYGKLHWERWIVRSMKNRRAVKKET